MGIMTAPPFQGLLPCLFYPGLTLWALLLRAFGASYRMGARYAHKGYPYEE